MSSIREIFDIDGRWHEVVPHLNDRRVVRALNAGMNAWCVDRNKTWDPVLGPYSYSRTDYWFNRSTDALNESQEYADLPWHEEEEEDEDEDYSEEFYAKAWQIEKQFYPQPNTPDWYRCLGACHCPAPWNATLGSCVFPELQWHVISDENHSTAIGQGQRTVIFDILWNAETWAKNGADFDWSADLLSVAEEIDELKRTIRRGRRRLASRHGIASPPMPNPCPCQLTLPFSASSEPSDVNAALRQDAGSAGGYSLDREA